MPPLPRSLRSHIPLPLKGARGWLLLLFAAPALAAPVTSPGPDAVAVTIYRESAREAGGRIDLDELAGFALIAEQRRITIPAGEAVLRFEGVADGILPESAIVEGLPAGIVEKNRDARLLSPAGLIDASIGQTVTLIRTDRATGKVTSTPAVVRSGPDGGVVFETAQGVEALRCTGLPERLVFDHAPEGLSARPVLSVKTRSDHAITATVTLAYLARGFDWTANYVATIRPDGASLDLTGWITLANGNSTGFARANTAVVAGTVYHKADGEEAEAAAWDGELIQGCWPWRSGRMGMPLLPPAVAAPAMEAMMGLQDIIVTAQKRASQEDLGDLKLYHVPEPVTVAARGQKQTLMIEQAGVLFHPAWRITADDLGDAPSPATLLLKLRNRTSDGLGLPLPSGQVAMMEQASGRPTLLGQSALHDTPLDGEIELTVGDSPAVSAAATTENLGKDHDRVTITLTNARGSASAAEIAIRPQGDHRYTGPSKPRRKGNLLIWDITLPANGTATFRYDDRS